MSSRFPLWYMDYLEVCCLISRCLFSFIHRELDSMALHNCSGLFPFVKCVKVYFMFQDSYLRKGSHRRLKRMCSGPSVSVGPWLKETAIEENLQMFRSQSSELYITQPHLEHAHRRAQRGEGFMTVTKLLLCMSALPPKPGSHSTLLTTNTTDTCFFFCPIRLPKFH
jgi:hypothetical protein